MSDERQNAQTSRIGWRPRRRSDAALARDIAAAMRETPSRDIGEFTSRQEIVERVAALLSQQDRNIMTQQTTMSNVDLANIAVSIIRETMSRGNNPKVALEPYSEEVRGLVKARLTHSERKAAGLLSDDEPDGLEIALRVMVRDRAAKMLGEAFDASKRIVEGTSHLYYEMLRV